MRRAVPLCGAIEAPAWNEDESMGGAERSLARFGSPVGWVFVGAILLILGFAVFIDVRPGQAVDRLRTGMTPTEVAAILGAARTESRSGRRLVQTWHLPHGETVEVEFDEGRLVSRRRSAR
jgi:hypothetical protein